MTFSLFDYSGSRKYLVSKERRAFVQAALDEEMSLSTLCLTLAFTGARISEALALTGDRIDTPNNALVFRTLKQRKKIVFRAVPIPSRLTKALCQTNPKDGERLWRIGRTKAWSEIKRVMEHAGIAERLRMPKALRHGFAVEAGQCGVPLNIVQRWLGHARIETTAIYAGVLGPEERNLARMTWKTLESMLPPEYF